MHIRKWVVLSSCATLLGVLVIGSWRQTAVGQGRSVAEAVTRVDPLAHLTRVQLDVFELTCTYDRLADFSLDRIGANQPTTREVLTRLAELGAGRLMLHYDSVVDLLTSTSIGSGLRVPVVDDVVVSSNGNFVPSINYQHAGFNGQIKGAWLDDDDPTQARVSLRLSHSDLLNERMAVTDNVDAPTFNERLTIDETRVLKSQVPIWIALNDPRLQANADTETKLTVIRLKATRLTDK